MTLRRLSAQPQRIEIPNHCISLHWNRTVRERALGRHGGELLELNGG